MDRGQFQILAKDADCLIVDAQYTPEEYPAHEGWGHSTRKQAVESAIEAGAKKVILVHHDPYHDDESIEEIVAESGKLHTDVAAAREGLEVSI